MCLQRNLLTPIDGAREGADRTLCVFLGEAVDAAESLLRKSLSDGDDIVSPVLEAAKVIDHFPENDHGTALKLMAYMGNFGGGPVGKEY